MKKTKKVKATKYILLFVLLVFFVSCYNTRNNNNCKLNCIDADTLEFSKMNVLFCINKSISFSYYNKEYEKFDYSNYNIKDTFYNEIPDTLLVKKPYINISFTFSKMKNATMSDEDILLSYLRNYSLDSNTSEKKSRKICSHIAYSIFLEKKAVAGLIEKTFIIISLVNLKDEKYLFKNEIYYMGSPSNTEEYNDFVSKIDSTIHLHIR